MYFSIVFYPFTVHQRKISYSVHKQPTFSNKIGGSCSHPDCLKLPHAEKQSENVDLKNFCFRVELVLNSHLCFGLLSSEGAMSSRIQSLPLFLQTPTSLTPHTHTPPWTTGAANQGREPSGSGYSPMESTPHKQNHGSPRRATQNNQGGLSLCV